MPTFFTGAGGFAPAGRTIALPDYHAQGTTSLVEVDPALKYVSQQSIITRLALSHQANVQFLHTVGNDVYIYVFGDRMGRIVISGLSLAADCGGASGGGNEHGFEKILRWYRDNRVVRRKAPVRVTIGAATTIEGFVVNLDGDIVDPLARVMQYTLVLATIPERD